MKITKHPIKTGRWLKPSEVTPDDLQLILMQHQQGGILPGLFLDDDVAPRTEKRKDWIVQNWGTFEQYRAMNPRFTIAGSGSHPWDHTEHWFGIPDPPKTRRSKTSPQ
jgi:hypothetical protein